MVLKLRKTRRTFGSAESTRRLVDELSIRPASFGPPKALSRRFDVTVRRYRGWPVYELVPTGVAPAQRALYFHGGAWIKEIDSRHWGLIADLAAATGTQFTIPIYPLAPVGTAASVVPVLTELAIDVLAAAGPENSVLMGDSAGGGMALATAMELRDRGQPLPRDTVLISPALDVRFDDPRIAVIAPSDPYLAAPGVRVTGRLWRGDLRDDDPMVSPLSGDLTGLTRITVFSGTRDILNPDAKALVSAATRVGVEVAYYEAPDMLHIYPLLPIPEAKPARRLIKEILAQRR